MKIKKGDTVLVISGKDKGKTGKVLKAFPREFRVIVENVNLRKKHMRRRGPQHQGGIIEFPAPVHVSNLKLICPKCKNPTRVGYAFEGEVKFRRCKRCNAKFK